MTHPMCVSRVRKVSDSDLNNRGRVGACLCPTLLGYGFLGLGGVFVLLSSRIGEHGSCTILRFSST